MTALLVAVIAVLLLALGFLAWRSHRRAGSAGSAGSGAPARSRRILFPFAASDLSRRALDAALRIARADEAILVPVFLARVPMHLPLDAPLPRQSGLAIALQEAIEQRAAGFEVPVDARIERGRTFRHAVRETIAHESYERLVVAAADSSRHGLGPEDVAWLLATVPGEIVVVRAGADDLIAPPTAPAGSRSPRRRARTGERRGSPVAR